MNSPIPIIHRSTRFIGVLLLYGKCQVCVSRTRGFGRECRRVGKGCQARREGYPAATMTRSASLPTEVKDVGSWPLLVMQGR
jgi:hypothetical protein